jgi:hypothetical protein
MPRWSFLLLLPLAACADGPAPEPLLQASPAPTTLPGPPPRPPAGSGFIGATPEALRAALGEPLLRRNEGPAEIWLYAGGGCQLDVVFYATETGARVAHIQARAGGIAQRSEASCLRDISAQAARPAPRSSPPDAPAFPASEIEIGV